MSRHFWVLIHRYAGLCMAVFLLVVGLTGSVLAFYHELDDWLNPDRDRIEVQSRPLLTPLELRDRALALVPGTQNRFVDFQVERNRSYAVGLEPDIDPVTGVAKTLGNSTIKLNPYSGVEISRDNSQFRSQSFWPLTHKNVLEFIYMLHMQLALGETGGFILGITALVWFIDCFIALYLTLPARKLSVVADDSISERGDHQVHRSLGSSWAVAWKIKWPASPFRLNFDLHRAGGLWTWVLLFMFAWSSGTFNLPQVFHPLNNYFFERPEDVHPQPNQKPQPEPKVDYRTAHAIGERLMAEQAQRYGFKVAAEYYLAYSPDTGLFTYSVNGDELFGKQDGTFIQFDAVEAKVVRLYMPSGLHPGITLQNWLSALHMATIGGRPYQILVCVMGLVITMLSVTGIYIWLKKRNARRISLEKRTQLEVEAST
ncbi:MAG: PepSY-associated TM helix domain-containing protein [Gallionella sp.]